MKNRKFEIAIIICILIVFNVVAFTISIEHTSAFWVAYAFSNYAIIVQFYIWRKAFESENTSKSKFLGIPIVNIGCIYVVAQLIVFAIATNASLSFSKSVILCTITFGVFAVLLISGEASKQESKKIIEDTRRVVEFIESSRQTLEMMIACETDEAKAQKLSNLLEEFRYSDPRSDEMLASIETIISGKLEELKYTDDYSKLIDEVSKKLKQRNIMCKNNK